MFTYSRPSWRQIKRRLADAMQEPSKKGAWLLKLGQTVFVGLTVLSFALLFHGK